jgi:tetratricopeptide (TPR) repeat protein
MESKTIIYQLNILFEMKRITTLFLIMLVSVWTTTLAQTNAAYNSIDNLLIQGEFNRVVDTCQQILSNDSLNAAIYYKMGLAYQNLMRDNKSLDCFLQAATISPDNKIYNFMLAKGYYSKGEMNQAKPLLKNLCSVDSMSWTYAYYLTSIYMQEKKHEESINIYNRFLQLDSSNYMLLDKIGFAYLKKGDFENAVTRYNKSLALNEKNISSIKNLSFLYALTYRPDTAIVLLTKGIEIDSTDMDLFTRRASLNYSLSYTKRAMDDYLKILNSGDSSVLFLKRAGIGYHFNLQPEKAIEYLLLAYQKDTSNIEVVKYLAEDYNKIKDLNNSVIFYKHAENILSPFAARLSYNYLNLAEVLKKAGRYNEAIDALLKCQKLRSDAYVEILIANIYDEKLKNYPKAIIYYQMYLDKLKKSGNSHSPEYTESISNRLAYLKEQQ